LLLLVRHDVAAAGEEHPVRLMPAVLQPCDPVLHVFQQLHPRGLLALSTVKSATTPSTSTIGACSLAVDEEKMFHEEQLLHRGKIHRNVKISSTTGNGKKFTD
jgi:hypothetical protein